jgi:hypothetical protein
MDQFFGIPFMEQFEMSVRQKLIRSMMAFVYAHRHNKDDLFLKESNIDFTILRDCMYHYSKKAQDRFFSQPVETFFFAKFATSPDAIGFINNKSNMSSEN